MSTPRKAQQPQRRLIGSEDPRTSSDFVFSAEFSRGPITESPISRKRQLVDGSPDNNKPQRSKTMEAAEAEMMCPRCPKPLNPSFFLICGGPCRRSFHTMCFTRDEEDPKTAKSWKCRVCSAAAVAGPMSADSILAELDKQPLSSELMTQVCRMVLMNKTMDPNSVSARVLPPQSVSAELCQTEECTAKGPKPTVLVVGDKKLREVKGKILAQMPKDCSVVIRPYSSPETASILEKAREFLEKNPQPVHVVLHAGHEECVDFKSDAFLKSVSSFACCLKQQRPDCSMSVITVPQFTKESKDVNEALTAHQEEWKLNVVDLTKGQRAMVLKGKYGYSGTPDLVQLTSGTIAKKACDLLGTKPLPWRCPPRTSTSPLPPSARRWRPPPGRQHPPPRMRNRQQPQWRDDWSPPSSFSFVDILEELFYRRGRSCCHS